MTKRKQPVKNTTVDDAEHFQPNAPASNSLGNPPDTPPADASNASASDLSNRFPTIVTGKPSAILTGKPRSPFEWPMLPLYPSEPVEDCLRELGRLLQERAEAYHRPSPEVAEDPEASAAAWDWAFMRPLDEDLRQAGYERAVVWLKLHAPGIVFDLEQQFEGLRKRIPFGLEATDDTPEEIIILLANTAWFLLQASEEIRATKASDAAKTRSADNSGAVRAYQKPLFVGDIPKDQDIHDLAVLLNTEHGKPKDQQRSDNKVALAFTKEKTIDHSNAGKLLMRIRKMKREGEINL